MILRQGRLIDSPMVGLYPISLAEANWYLEAWGHRLGKVERPFRSEAYCLELHGRRIAVAVSASIVSKTVYALEREEVVELARLASCEPWATRVMLRLWRECCAPIWKCWPVKAAISYSQTGVHSGNLYRFDGWEKIREDCGSTGGGTWTKKRKKDQAVSGKKTLWVWSYEKRGKDAEGRDKASPGAGSASGLGLQARGP